MQFAFLRNFVKTTKAEAIGNSENRSVTSMRVAEAGMPDEIPPTQRGGIIRNDTVKLTIILWLTVLLLLSTV
jgi:hypothetical protein